MAVRSRSRQRGAKKNALEEGWERTVAWERGFVGNWSEGRHYFGLDNGVHLFAVSSPCRSMVRKSGPFSSPAMLAACKYAST
jgi:hypothetical protein